MTAQQQAFDARFEEKLNTLMPYIRKLSAGNDDLVQEATIGVWESMMNEPETPKVTSDQYYRNKARWNVLRQINGVGRSVDIPKAYPRKWPISIVHYDAIPDNSDAELSQAILADRRRVPLDDWVISKLDFERFIATLTSTEAGYVRYKILEELPDTEAADRMDWSLDKLKYMKKKLRGKIEVFFSV